jgi:hypothetical protein
MIQNGNKVEEYDELDKYIDGLINEELVRILKDQIGPCTCQLLRQDSENRLVPFASGVLAELGRSHYILTASHVIEDWSDANRLFIEIKDGHISVAGKACGTQIEKKGIIDTAYIKLKDAIIPILRLWYKFLPLEKFLEQKKIAEESSYCVYGYPTGNPRNEKQRTIGAGYFLKPSQNKVFEYYNFDTGANYVLEFAGKAINIKTGEPEKIKVDHYGLSGGGLWHTVIENDGEKFISDVRLVGIMTEFRKGKYNCLIANRVEVLLLTIHQNEEMK